jgi:type II secretory pathway pseudopilin PulG
MQRERPLTARFAGSDGFMIVELLVAASVLGVIGMGLFVCIAGSSHGSANNRNRSIAASLAQQDQERMRTMKATALAGYKATRTITVAGVQYTVASAGQWTSDSSGVISCTSGSAKANYLRTTSTVTWAAMGGLKPIVLTSLVAPPPGSFATNQGALAVQIVDQSSNPVRGVPVTLGSPANKSDSTDSDGCAVFAGIAAGAYAVSFSSSGYVDPSGANSVSRSVTVVAQTTTTASFLYGQAGSIAVGFDTKIGAGTPQPVTATSLTVSHSGIPAPGTRVSTAAPASATITATNLYPFTSGYGVYAGSCAANDPTAYNPGYYSSNPGLVTVAPGISYAVTVRQPAISIAVTRGGSPYGNAHVVVKTTAAGCAETYPAQYTNAQGALPSPAFPFGTYSVCADDGSKKVTNSNVQNTSAAGTATVALAITGSSSAGVCP